jgi:transposase InsO family protein
MLWRYAATGLSSANRHAKGIHAAGHDQSGAGVSRNWCGSIHHQKRSNASQLRLPWLPEQQQRRHLSWQSPVWASDITYIPLQKGFLYLVAIVDLSSRNVLSWKLSNSLVTEFCLDALGMALETARKPEIFHSDQGCQFTSGIS